MNKNTNNLAHFLLSQDVPDEHVQSYFHGQAFTIGSYRKVAAELTDELEAAGVPENISALLLFDDTPLALAMFLACISHGIVPLMSSTLTLDAVVEKTIDAADITLVISDGSRDLSAFSSRVILGELTGKVRPTQARLTLTNDPSAITPRPVDAEKYAFFLMTTGSTGTPKIVEHVHGGMVFTTRVYGKETLGITPEDTIYSIAKTSFGYGLFNNLFLSFATGAAAYLEDFPFDVATFFANLGSMHPTVLFGIPTAYQMILNYVGEHPEEKEKLLAIKSFISSGETLREDISRAWKNLTGVYIKDNMGSSEASAILLNEGAEGKYGSSGKPVKDSEVRLIGADGRDSDTGSLYFRSDGNAVGYYKNPEENALHYNDEGYLVTGDVFTIDEDGYYWYVGREDNLMKYHGFWVFPQGIEQKIKDFGGVKQVVVTKATVDGVDILAAALVPEPDFAGTDALASYLEKELEIYKRPKKYITFEAFPLNERGKVNLKLIKEIAEK